MGKGRREAALEIKKSVMTIYLYQFQIARLNLLPHDPANFSKFFYQPGGTVTQVSLYITERTTITC